MTFGDKPDAETVTIYMQKNNKMDCNYYFVYLYFDFFVNNLLTFSLIVSSTTS